MSYLTKTKFLDQVQSRSELQSNIFSLPDIHTDIITRLCCNMNYIDWSRFWLLPQHHILLQIFKIEEESQCDINFSLEPTIINILKCALWISNMSFTNQQLTLNPYVWDKWQRSGWTHLLSDSEILKFCLQLLIIFVLSRNFLLSFYAIIITIDELLAEIWAFLNGKFSVSLHDITSKISFKLILFAIEIDTF